MQQLIAPNMEYPSILELGKVFTSIAWQCEWEIWLDFASLCGRCVFVCVCMCVCILSHLCVHVSACKREHLQVPVEVKAKSQKRELHQQLASVCSHCSLVQLLWQQQGRLYPWPEEEAGIPQEQTFHPILCACPPPPPPARMLTLWWTCLGVRGQWLRAAEWQWGMMRERMRKRGVTPYRWGGEMRKWNDKTKFDYYREVGVVAWENGCCLPSDFNMEEHCHALCVCVFVYVCGHMLCAECEGGSGDRGRRRAGRWICVTSTFLFIVWRPEWKCFPPEMCTGLPSKGMRAESYLYV